MTLQISTSRQPSFKSVSVRSAVDLFFFLRLSIPICSTLTLRVIAGIGDTRIPFLLYPLCFCATWLVYLIDYDPRVSPEDVSVHPERYAFYLDHVAALQNLRYVLAVLSFACALCLLPDLERLPILAAPVGTVVLFYVSPAVPFLRHLPKLKLATRAKTSAVALTWWLAPWAAVSAFDPRFRFAHLFAMPSLIVLIAIVVETVLRDLFDGDCDAQHGIRSFANLYPNAARIVLFAGALSLVPMLLEIRSAWRASILISSLCLLAILSLCHRVVALRALHRIADLALICFLAVL